MTVTESNSLARRLKEYRKAKRMSQKDFAAYIGLPYRTYQNYESGARYPKNIDVVNKMAVALGTTTEELLGSDGVYIIGVGRRDQQRLAQLVSQMTAMFAGSELDEESRDAAMQAISQAYWNRKNADRQRFTTQANNEKKEA